MLFPSLAPSHPGGTQQVAPSSSTTVGPADGERLAAVEVERGARADFGGSHGDQLDRASAVRVAVALLVRAMERLDRVAAERNGQLEGLPLVAKVGVAFARQRGRLPRSGMT